MSRPAPSATRYLDKKNGKWLVSLPVPKPLHTKLGKRLRRYLGTESLAEANALKCDVVAELRAVIAEAALEPLAPSSLQALAEGRPRATAAVGSSRHRPRAPVKRPTSYLDRSHGRWRVSFPVPTHLRPLLGNRLRRALQTGDLGEANRLKLPIIREMQATIAEAERQHAVTYDPHAAAAEFAARFAQRLASAGTSSDCEALKVELAALAEALNPQTGWVDEGAGIAAYRTQGEGAAENLFAVALNQSCTIDHHQAAFLQQQETKARTQADDVRAVRYLVTWCERNRIRPTLQAITRRQAIAFMDGMESVAGGLSPVTLNKYLTRLSAYWRWLTLREHAAGDVWSGLSRKLPRPKWDEKERPFTDEEMGKLLGGPALPEMSDLMRIAALTGARLDAIVDLKVRDCAGGLFTFKPQKREVDQRMVPIHSALAEVVQRRAEGKALGADMFPEWPAPKQSTSMRERSFKASNHFTEYRRSVGVDATVEGKRRALTNFHSFRRWFITQAERADQPESLIAAVVGHKRTGITLGVYSAGPLIEQARRCVEAVKLPGL